MGQGKSGGTLGMVSESLQFGSDGASKQLFEVLWSKVDVTVCSALSQVLALKRTVTVKVTVWTFKS